MLSYVRIGFALRGTAAEWKHRAERIYTLFMRVQCLLRYANLVLYDYYGGMSNRSNRWEIEPLT